LIRVKVLWGLYREPLLPKAVDVALALFVCCSHIQDDLLQLFQRLEILDQGVGSAVWLTEERGDLGVEDLTSTFDVFIGIQVISSLDLEYSLIKTLLKWTGGVRLLKDFDILGKVGPFT
jgi:hypothetical protein